MENPHFFDFKTKEEAQDALLNNNLIFERDCVIDGIVLRVAGEEVLRVRIATDDNGNPVMVKIANNTPHPAHSEKEGK